jgi:hypothetical protein
MLGGLGLDDATWDSMASGGPIGGQLHDHQDS